MRQNKTAKIAVYYLASFLQGICVVIIPASSFIFKAPGESAITDAQYGLLFLPMLFTAVAALLVLPWLLDRFGRRRIFYFGVFSNAVFLLLLLLAYRVLDNNALCFAYLFAGCVFLDAGIWLLVSILNIFVIDLYPKRRDAMLTGLHSFFGIGAAFAPIMAGAFHKVGHWSWSVVLTLSALAALAVFARLTKAAVDKAVTETARGQRISFSKAASGGAVFFLLAVFIYGVLESIVGNWTTIYLTTFKNFSVQSASLSLSLFWAFVTIGRVAVALLAVRIDARLLYRLSPVLIVASLWLIIAVRSEEHILLPYILAGLGFSYCFPLTVSLATQYHNDLRDLLSSLSVSGLMLGLGGGSLAAGFLSNHGLLDLNQLFVIALLFSAALAVLAFFLTRKKVPLLEND